MKSFAAAFWHTAWVQQTDWPETAKRRWWTS